jgi:hypothetical protein
VEGYAVAIAVESTTGCPLAFNHLAGVADVKLASGHMASLPAQAIAALYDGVLPGCMSDTTTATLDFDGVEYNRLARQVALDQVASRADGNDTQLVIDRVDGTLGGAMSAVGMPFGLFYDDAANVLSFSLSQGSPQLRGTLSNTFPRLTPRFETFIPTGRTGWLRAFRPDDAGFLGAALNFNLNAATAGAAFTGGHNLHHLTLSAADALSLPVITCDSLEVQPLAVPPAMVGGAYGQQFTAAGGLGPFLFAFTGELPAGTMFNGDSLDGTPLQAGAFGFTIHVVDANGCRASRDYELLVFDDDGVDAATESGAPNQGDGNGDGIADSIQCDVASLPSSTGRGYLTIAVAGGCGELRDVTSSDEAELGNDPGYLYPFGLVGFSLPCPEAQVTIFYHGAAGVPAEYREFGPMAPRFGAPRFYGLPGVVFGGAIVGGEHVPTAVLNLRDGQLGDGTPVDGRILDPGGPAERLMAVPVLATSQGRLVALLVLLLVGWGGFRYRRKDASC